MTNPSNKPNAVPSLKPRLETLFPLTQVGTLAVYGEPSPAGLNVPIQAGFSSVAFRGYESHEQALDLVGCHSDKDWQMAGSNPATQLLSSLRLSPASSAATKRLLTGLGGVFAIDRGSPVLAVNIHAASAKAILA